jgi:membrane-bound lytic murein transglycosylase D
MPVGAAHGSEVAAGGAEGAREGVSAWVERLDGEDPAAEVAAAAEASEEDLRERSLQDEPFGLDVPDDFYRNPERALLGDPLHLEKIDLSEFDIPIEVNPHVERWMRILLGPSRKHMERWLERKSKFEPIIQAELAKARLPRDLIYLSMIESGFNPNAYSHAAAAGLWQFIQPTARMYGLDVDFWIDERRDPEKATVAATKMLGELHRRFGHWYLAFAAYNTGPARIARNVDRLEAEGSAGDFWTMLDRDMLHPETSGYVPKIVAAAIIGKHPERYGFTALEPEPAFVYDTVALDHAVDLEVLAECAGVDLETLKGLNPALRRYAVPEGGTEVRLPFGTLAAFEEAYAKVPPEERRRVVVHAVRRGESLGAIASRYGVSVTAVAAANGLPDVNHISVGQQLVIPLSGSSRASEAVDSAMSVRRVEPARVEAAVAAPTAGTKDPPRESPPTEPARTDGADRPGTHTVRAGESLSAIAVRYGVAVSDLVAWNGLRDADAIQVGQALTLVSGGAGAPSAAATPSVVRYTVRSGDTLSEIAERHGVSLAALQRSNGIRDAGELRVGQVLRIEGGRGATTSEASATAAASWSTHTVRSGESLGLIAERYGVSVGDLKSWNGLRSSTIYPGDRLKIRKR